MLEVGQAFVAGILFAGLFRLTVGQIVLFENGKWTLRFSRFDAREEAINARVNEAMSLGYRKGIEEAARAVCSGCASDEPINRFGYHYKGSYTHPCHAAAIRKLGEQRDASD